MRVNWITVQSYAASRTPQGQPPSAALTHFFPAISVEFRPPLSTLAW